MANQIINSTITLYGNLHVGDIYNNVVADNETRIVWGKLMKLFSKRKTNSYIDIFYWNNACGQLNHLVADEKLFENDLENYIDYGDEVELKIIPFSFNKVKVVKTNETIRDFSFSVAEDGTVKFDDGGGHTLEKKISTGRTVKIDGKYWTIKKVNLKKWFEYDNDNFRINLVFNPALVKCVYVVSYMRRGIPLHYVLVAAEK